MTFRNDKFTPRHKDIIFELETPLISVVGNNAHQKNSVYKFVADNSGEDTPFDWYNARIALDFKINTLADGRNIAVDDHHGIVNGSHSFIKNLNIKVNGIEVYKCNNANHCVNLKNLLEYSPQYAESTATNEFFYLETSRHAEEGDDQRNYNKGFAARKALLGASSTVNIEIPLNRHSFFEVLRDELLPNTRVLLELEIESYDNLIWQAGNNCRVVITKMQLIVPLITVTPEGHII